MTACCRSLSCFAVTTSIGILLVLAASLLIGLDVGNTLINKELDKQLVLSQDSPTFSQWMNPVPPIYMQYWFFNVTNPEEVVKGGKPSVKEIGPFTYRLHQPRMNVAFYTNSTVSYMYNHTLVFQKDKSCHDTNFPIKQLNVPLLTVQTLAQSLPSIVREHLDLVAKAEDDSSLFVEHTVEEWLFGYEDPILKVIHDAAKLLHDLFGLDVNIPKDFGLFYQFNNSDDGVYLVNTGKGDVSQANTIQKWNCNDSLPYWTSAESNMINGTDGIFMTPKVKKSDTLYIYNTDICRSIYVKYANETSVRGINTFRFHLEAEVFANATENPSNAGFCVPAGNCLDAGVLSLSPCKQGAPVMISSPHFYLGAEKYVKAVDGIHPEKQYHETYLDIEPMTGAVFSAMKRLQVNIHLQDLGVFSQTEHVKEVIMPVVWLNESVYLDAATAKTFKSEVLALINAVHILPYVILACGLFLTVLGAGLILHKAAKSRNKHVALVNVDEDADEDKQE